MRINFLSGVVILCAVLSQPVFAMRRLSFFKENHLGSPENSRVSCRLAVKNVGNNQQRVHLKDFFLMKLNETANIATSGYQFAAEIIPIACPSSDCAWNPLTKVATLESGGVVFLRAIQVNVPFDDFLCTGTFEIEEDRGAIIANGTSSMSITVATGSVINLSQIVINGDRPF